MGVSATESMLYRSTANWHEAGKATIVGIVSRYIEFYMLTYFPSIFTKWSRDQKFELVVFVVSAVYSLLMDRKKAAFLFGFKKASSDLWVASMFSFLDSFTRC